MRRAAGIAGLAIAWGLLASCAAGGAGSADQRLARGLRPIAQPSEVIAAELAFARAAQEKGQWTAFAAFAARDAAMFVPGPVNAQEWLKGRENPAQAVKWQPHRVWSSCDGSLAVTRGAWQRSDGSHGYFTTVWRRQEDGSYRWMMDEGGVLAEPLEEPEMIEARVAECRPGNPVPAPGEPVTGAQDRLGGGRSDDGTLRWRIMGEADGSRTVEVLYWDGAGWQVAVREWVAGSRAAA